MNRSVSFHVHDNGLITIHGKLVFSTVMAIFKDSLKWFLSQKSTITANFKSVTEVDSAALALLIEWKRLAKKHSISVCFVDLPESLQRLAELSRINHWLTD